MQTIINIIVLDNSDNTILENHCVIEDVGKAEELFIEKCEENFSNFNEYSDEDIQNILDNGYEASTHRTVFISWATIN